MKYVIFQGNGFVYPVLFADHTTHAQVKIEGAYPIAAGFVRFDSCNLPHCYGKSDSLHLESRGEIDDNIIRRWQINSNMTTFMEELNEPF